MKKDHEDLKTVFSRTVHEQSIKLNQPIIETIGSLLEEFGIEQEDVGKYVTEHLKQLLRAECEKNFLFRPTQVSGNIEQFMS